MEAKEETVNARHFKTSPLPATTSLRLWAKILKQHGGQLGELFGSMSDQDESAAAQALGAVCTSLDVDLIEEIRRTFSQVSQVDGRQINSDAAYGAAFNGRIGDQMAWLKHCLTAEYAHFFEALAGADLGALAGAQTTPST